MERVYFGFLHPERREKGISGYKKFCENLCNSQKKACQMPYLYTLVQDEAISRCSHEYLLPYHVCISFCQSIRPSNRLYVSLFYRQFIFTLSVCSFVRLPLWPSALLTICLSVRLSFCLFLSVHTYVCLFFPTSVHLSCGPSA